MPPLNPRWREPGDPLYVHPHERTGDDQDNAEVPRAMFSLHRDHPAEPVDPNYLQSTARWPEPFDDQHI